MKTWSRLAVVAMTAALVTGACSDDKNDKAQGGALSTTSSINLTQGSNIRIEVVTHGQASDPFWSVVKKGIDDGAKDAGVSVNYSAPDTFDMVKMSQLIDAAVAKKPAGLIVSLPDYGALKDSLGRAKAAGIPIITINSGSDHLKEIGALTHIGQDESVAGQAAGQRLVDAGAKKVVCINQEVGNAGLDARCAGAKKTITAAGGTLEVLQVDLKDAAGAQNTIAAKLQSNSAITGLLALGPTGSAPALAAMRATNKAATVKLATFDLSPAVIDAIASGEMLFAVDQQQYLQGYLAVDFMKLYVANLNTVGGGLPVLTGPGFVTKDNAERVKALASSGSR